MGLGLVLGLVVGLELGLGRGLELGLGLPLPEGSARSMIWRSSGVCMLLRKPAGITYATLPFFMFARMRSIELARLARSMQCRVAISW